MVVATDSSAHSTSLCLSALGTAHVKVLQSKISSTVRSTHPLSHLPPSVSLLFVSLAVLIEEYRI